MRKMGKNRSITTAGLTAMAAGLALQGCAPSVELSTPPPLLSVQWDDDTPTQGESVSIEQSWTAFGSEELSALIERGRSANPDIAIAIARISQARGDLGVARAVNGPLATASADASSDIRNLKGQTKGLDRIGSAGLDISYDLDLFGAGRSGKNAAWARLKAAGYDRQAINLAIESDIASAFVQHTALSDRAKLLARASANAQELERIIRLRAREGVASPLDVGLQTTEGDVIKVGMSRITEAKAISKNAMAVLLGEEAPDFAMAQVSLSILDSPEFDRAQPSDITVRRPDIKAAEARIAAANGDVGQARAAFMPSIRLSASSFFDIARSGGLINAGAAGAFGILATIFDSGRLKGRIFRASGEQKEAVEIYRKTVLTALAEVQNALASATESRQRLDILNSSQKTATRNAALARQQYIEGGAYLNTVLDADRRLIEVEESLVLAKQENLLAAITLYRALGGAPQGSSDQFFR